jgi:uncharacterized repeat protein (TIGR02543 family)
MLLLSLTLWQCKNDDYKETTGVCPEVVSTIPAHNAINVVATKPVTVTFNETMNATTITTSTFLLSQGTNPVTGMKQAAVPVSGTVTPSTGETATFTFTPASPLAPFTQYTGTMKKGVKDPMNNMLQEDYIWSFTTQPLASFSTNPVIGGTISGGGLYNTGTTVTANVVPNAGYVFANWTENGVVVSTTAIYPFEIAGNRTLVANFIAQYTLGITSLPLIGGTTTGSGAYNSGTSVTATATPAVGYTFTNWTEGTNLASALKIYTFPLTASRVLVANFSINMYLLTIITPNGTVAKVPSQTTYSHGTSVLLTATPAVGYTFTSWSGDATGTTNPVTVIMDSEKTITANYTAIIPKYTVGVSSNPLLSGTTTGGGSFNSGASVSVGAVPAVGFTFTNWTEGTTIVSSNANYTFTLAGNKTLVANFAPVVVQFQVGLTSSPLLGGTTTGGGSFNSGASVTVGAVPAVGYTFTNWKEGTNIVSTNANYTFVLSANKNLVATFTPVVVGQFLVGLSSSPLLGGTTNGGGTFNSGSSVTVGAVPAIGYTFTNWKEGTNIVSTNANYTFVLSANKNLVATFTPVVAGQFLVDISANPLFGGSTNGEGLYNSGALVNLKATANTGFSFTNWTEGANIVSTNANYSFTISGNRIFVANFKADVILPSGPAGIDLGSAADFAVLAGSGVSNTGVTTKITGDVGSFPTATINGLLAGNVIGKLYTSADPIVGLAKVDLTTAYNDGQSRSLNAISLPGQLGGLTLAPGLYVNSSTSGISGTGPNGILTLDAGGNANAVWIFKMGSTLVTDAGTSIVLAGGAQAKNIYWVVGTSATLGTNSIFYGNILADQAISLTTGAKLYGRALTRIAAVTLDSNIVTKP